MVLKLAAILSDLNTIKWPPPAQYYMAIILPVLGVIILGTFFTIRRRRSSTKVDKGKRVHASYRWNGGDIIELGVVPGELPLSALALAALCREQQWDATVQETYLLRGRFICPDGQLSAPYGETDELLPTGRARLDFGRPLLAHFARPSAVLFEVVRPGHITRHLECYVFPMCALNFFM